MEVGAVEGLEVGFREGLDVFDVAMDCAVSLVSVDNPWYIQAKLTEIKVESL